MQGSKFAAGLVLAASVGSAASAQQDGATGRQGWAVSSSTTACLGTFHSDDDFLSLRAERSYLGTTQPVLYLSTMLEWTSARAAIVPFSLRLAGDSQPLGDGTMLLRADDQTASARARLEGQALTQLAVLEGTARLEFLNDGKVIGVRDTAAFADGTVMLDECFAELGEDLMAAQPPGRDSRPGPYAPVPRNYPGKWVTTSDYPAEALRAEQEGRTTSRLSVNRYGFVTACEIIESSGSPLLDEATCRNMASRAQFYPARDSGGEAAEATFTQSVQWIMPE